MILPVGQVCWKGGYVLFVCICRGDRILPVGQVCWKGGYVLFVYLFVLADGSVTPGLSDLFSLGVGEWGWGEVWTHILMLFLTLLFLSSLQTCTESVTSVQGGVVSTPGYDEIICSTYAGT